MERKTRRNRFVALFMTLALMFSFMAPLSQPTAAQEGSDYCYVDLNKGGGTWRRIQEGVTADASVDCLDVIKIEQRACYLNMGVVDRVQMLTKTGVLLTQQAKIWWSLGSVRDDANRQIFPAVFNNGEGDGSVQIVVWVTGLEEDWYFYANEDPYPYPYPKAWHKYGDTTPNDGIVNGTEPFTRGGGVVHTVDTNCPPDPTVYGCSQGYFKNNGWGADTKLSDIGLVNVGDPTDATLLTVLSNPGSGKVQKGVQTYDGLTRQRVTAWLNISADMGYGLTWEQVLAADIGTLEYNNHGGEGVVCPLG